jgi:hypothetical protein
MTLAKRSPGKAAVVCVANPADGDPRVFVVLTEEVLRELGKALEKV